jgi:hypothetical protein
MPDIAMCLGVSVATPSEPSIVCPMRDRCYRHTATPHPSGWQSYFMGLPDTTAIVAAGQCSHFVRLALRKTVTP